jgi:hypothetical protein
VSIPRATPASTASKATAAASAPFPELAPTNGTSSRLAQIPSCSVAPARKVSAAASNTLRPSALRRCALGDRGGLAGPIDAEHEHDRRRPPLGGGPRQRRTSGAELLDDDLLECGLIDSLGLAEPLDDFVGCRNAEIRLDEQLLDFFE